MKNSNRPARNSRNNNRGGPARWTYWELGGLAIAFFLIAWPVLTLVTDFVSPASVAKAATLNLVKSVDKSQGAPGDTIIYTIVITNTSGQDNFVSPFVDNVPASLTVVSAVSPGLTVTTSGNQVQAQGALTNNQSATVTITAQIKAGVAAGTLIDNQATGDVSFPPRGSVASNTVRTTVVIPVNPTNTSTIAPTVTNTVPPTNTSTVQPTATNTPGSTPTNTSAPTNTSVPATSTTGGSTATGTPQVIPSVTGTLAPGVTPTLSFTNPPNPTATNTAAPATNTPDNSNSGAAATATNTPNNSGGGSNPTATNTSSSGGGSGGGTTSGVINGSLSAGSQTLAGAQLSLILSGSNQVVKTTIVDSSNKYFFGGVPSTASGQNYYVRFSNSDPGSGLLNFFDTNTFAFSGGTYSIPNIDVGDIRTGPPGETSSALKLPLAVTWFTRGQNDQYYLQVLRNDNSQVFVTSPSGITSYTIQSGQLAEGNYTAHIVVQNNLGHGLSNRRFAFRVSATGDIINQPTSTPQPPATAGSNPISTNTPAPVANPTATNTSGAAAGQPGGSNNTSTGGTVLPGGTQTGSQLPSSGGELPIFGLTLAGLTLAFRRFRLVRQSR